MKLRALIRGASLAELNTNAAAACVKFYGTTPYKIVVNVYAAATAEKFDPTTGAVTGFMMDMEADPVTTP